MEVAQSLTRRWEKQLLRLLPSVRRRGCAAEYNGAHAIGGAGHHEHCSPVGAEVLQATKESVN